MPTARPIAISVATARRVALAAGGFARKRPVAPGRAQLLATADRLGLFQIDSVNVLARAQYLPAFSRLGPYDPTHLDKAAWSARRRSLFEYWGHEASLIPVSLQPLLRWRMQHAHRDKWLGGELARFVDERRDYVQSVLAEIRDRGPLSAADLTDAGAARGPWWGWSDGKRAAEYLFLTGQLVVASRRGAFERVYDLPERVLPPDILAAPTPPRADAQRALLRIAATAMGIATEFDLRTYFRLPLADARARIAELVEEGTLLPAVVQGWDQPAFLAAGAAAPRQICAQALLSPFDPLLWERDRPLRLFNFHYRIELYTPQHKRTHGYYVLPFLLNDQLVARVDLKADRATRTLHVLSSHAESHARHDEAAHALAAELRLLAAWQNLATINIVPRGDLAAALRAAYRT
jgi:uncharacterized protein YcaQ